MRRKSKSNTKKLQDKLWELCKQITRKQYGRSCYTCGAYGLEGSNWHTGHMWPMATLSSHLKYDLRVLRPQCYKCNIHYGGMGAEFYRRMLSEIGKKNMEALEKEKQILIKADELWYQEKINEYEEISNNLR